MDSLPPVRLGDYEGALDLLLDLVRRQQKDVLELSLADLADQFLCYVNQADSLDLRLGMDFGELACTLIAWKSRALLPSDPELKAAEADPRAELMRRLLEHERVKAAAGELQGRLQQSQSSFTRAVPAEASEPAEDVPHEGSVTLFDLIERFHELRVQAANRITLQVEREEIQLEDRLDWLRKRLTATPGVALAATPLFAEQPDNYCRAGLFLAILEAAKTDLTLAQEEAFGELWLLPLDYKLPV